MTLHHVEDTQRLFAEFFRLMNPGGWLAIADLDSEDGSFHPDTTGVMHYGFDRAHIQRQLETCGFSNIAASTAAILSRARDYPVFLITARK